MRRATFGRRAHALYLRISTHALREEGDVKGHRATAMQHISIHALREEGDVMPGWPRAFLALISTHALREEGDLRKSAKEDTIKYFYPRPP